MASLAASCAVGTASGQSFVPDSMAPSRAVIEAAQAEYLTPDERSDFRVMHGISDDTDLNTPERRARVALERLDVHDAAFSDATTPHALRLAALHARGAFAEIIAQTETLTDIVSRAFRAEALAMIGRGEEALALAASPEAVAALSEAKTVEETLAAVDVAALRIRLDATAASMYRALLASLARARQEIDRLDPRLRVREAELLAERHAMQEAVRTIGEALGLSPRCARAWRLAGDLALDQFDFDGAARAARALRRIAPMHPYAAILEARSALMQDDPATALRVLDAALAVSDAAQCELRAWRAAAEGSRYQFTNMQEELARFDALAPGSALALVVAGRQLVFDRQYSEARATLTAAATREPAWALPRAELGLLSMQDGNESRAIEDLKSAVALDPHDERTVFTLALAEQLAGWQRIETKYFTIRHPEGDAALVAALLVEPLDRMHEEVCQRLGHEPAQKTLLDVMPDHRSFGVRITGLPRIHTIAVCTGPTIAIEIPKDGPQSKHLGLFDPLAVLRHEYTHTVTLSMTKNRIPHWLTEAVAVALEDTPRTYDNCQLLAEAWRRGALFNLDEINWAFVRPERPTDRAQAYAQGRWMVEYVEVKFGWEALRTLLFSYADGTREDEAMRRAFGVSRDEFFRGFLGWAANEVRAWGLDPQPPLRDLLLEVAESERSAGASDAAARMDQRERERLVKVAARLTESVGAPGAERRKLSRLDWPSAPMPEITLDDAALAALLTQYPNHPDLIEITLRRAKEAVAANAGGSPALDDATRSLLERYATLRPVDPLPHRMWARYAPSIAQETATIGTGTGAANTDATALEHLRALDVVADKDNAFAIAISRNRRAAGDLAGAGDSAERAVRMNPFDATVRELAAAIAVEAGRLDRAERHIQALVVLEPDRALHRKRLAKIAELRAKSERTADSQP
jgi:tetratricopeptide (TPR) repeat protein